MNNEVYLKNPDGTLCDIQAWHKLAYDSCTHRTFDETIRMFRDNMEFFRKKGGEILAEKMGYTDQILKKKIASTFEAYHKYVLSGGAI